MHSTNVKSHLFSSTFTLLLLGVAAWLAGAAPVHAQSSAGKSAAAVPAAPPSLEQFVKLDAFEQLKISPTGEYLAASAPVDDKSVLIILRRSDMKRTGLMVLGTRTHVEDFWWVNDDRVLLTTSEKNGPFDTRYATGEIFGMDADGKNQSLLVGWRRGNQAVDSRIKARKQEFIGAFMVDDLRDSDDHVLISVFPFTASEEPFTTLQKLHVRTGARSVIARAPVRRASFTVDHAGIARFASGAGIDRKLKLYYRANGDAPWELLNDESKSGVRMHALGFRADDRIAYLQVEQPTGPDALMSFDAATRQQALVVRDAKVDPYELIWSADGATPIAARFLDGVPKLHYLDEAAKESRLLKSLHKGFPGHSVSFTGFTRDENRALVYVYSDRNPGDFYMFDIVKKEATHLASRRDWVDPERMATMQPVSIPARDGRTLHGFLSVPPGSDGKNLPLVVNPHGGPFGIADTWRFSTEPQLLASRGYAVLQVNFRGSGNYGREHVQAGYRQWGLKMQDDVTDATLWAVARGIASRDRVCIYGASYGAYAALMGAAKEPDLYRCAIGYVGVYDLPLMFQDGDIRDSKSGTNFLAETLGGDRGRLGQTSPSRLASQIKVPVFLAAGGADERAPLRHSELMRDALTAAGNKPEWLAYTNEGHGFYEEANQVEYYTKLLAFLDRHIGGGARN